MYPEFLNLLPARLKVYYAAMFSKFFAISTNTFREVIRQPVYGIILLVAVATIAFSPSFAMFSMMEDVKIVKDVGLATMLLAGLLVSAFSASAVLRHETENMTASTVLSKPVGRGTFVIAKYFGILMSLVLANYLILAVLVLVVRMGVPQTASWKLDVPVFLAEILPFIIAILMGGFFNYFYDWPFVSAAVVLSVPLYTVSLILMALIGPEWKLTVFAETLDADTALAGILVFMGVTVLSSVALAASTRLPSVATIIFCIGVLFAGMTSDYAFGQFAATHVPARIAYTVIPNVQAFWLADALSAEADDDDKKAGRTIPSHYLAWAAGYALLYQAGMICLAAMLFQKKEVT